MLVIFVGLPGTCKTMIAQNLARKLSAVYIRINSLEQALVGSGVIVNPASGPAGYFAGYAVAADNLRLGLPVVVDFTNPLRVTCEAWRDVALETGAQFLEIELVCSDPAVKRSRANDNTSEITKMTLPDWQNILARTCAHSAPGVPGAPGDPRESENKEHLVLDTAMISLDQAVEAIFKKSILTA